MHYAKGRRRKTAALVNQVKSLVYLFIVYLQYDTTANIYSNVFIIVPDIRFRNSERCRVNASKFYVMAREKSALFIIALLLLAACQKQKCYECTTRSTTQQQTETVVVLCDKTEAEIDRYKIRNNSEDIFTGCVEK